MVIKFKKWFLVTQIVSIIIFIIGCSDPVEEDKTFTIDKSEVTESGVVSEVDQSQVDQPIPIPETVGVHKETGVEEKEEPDTDPVPPETLQPAS